MKPTGLNPSSKDEQFTPIWVFEGLGVHFDLDVCAPIEHKDHVPASNRLTVLDDGLAQLWTGRVWMNPPYSNSTLWVDKFIEHGNGIALTQISKSKWFQKLWDSVDAMMLLPYNMKFVLPDETLNPIFMPTILSAIGNDNVEALKRLAKTRVR